MNNRLQTVLRGYVEALFKDLGFAYLQPRELVRDKTRLLHELEVNGLRVLTIDLPALGKHLDRCLENRVYIPSHGRYGRVGKAGVPVFLRDLYLQVFSPGGGLLALPSIGAIAALKQLFSCLKRLRVPYLEKGLRDEVNSFVSTESEIRPPDLDWNGDSPISDFPRRLSFDDFGDSQCSLQDIRKLSRVFDAVATSFGAFNPLEGTGLASRHGPGVVADLKRTESKYSFRDWPAKLDAVFPYDLYGTRDLGFSSLVGHELPYRNREVPSRMIAVPKEHSKPRLIAAEPSAHQWVQQSVRSWLEDRLKGTVLRNCISFRDQSRNQILARQGSIDGSLSTIDLSSASDRLSCATVERAFRSNPTLLDALHACRTRWLRFEHPTGGVNYLLLKKFAPMGSSVTFPVQSIVYACVAIAAVLIARNLKPSDLNIAKASKLVRVFGDDIIAPTDCCKSTLLPLLAFIGMKVNASKTFVSPDGRFRESCGVEAFMGFDITPARILNLDSVSSSCDLGALVAQVNNLWRKGWWNLANWLETSISRKYINSLPVISMSSGALGLASFCGSSFHHLRRRWSKDLHCEEYQVQVPRVRDTVLETDGHHSLFQWFTEMPDPMLKAWQPGIRVKTAAYTRLGWKSEMQLC